MPIIKLGAAECYFRFEGLPDLPVLALLHPVGADNSLWDRVVPLLLPHFRVLRPDLRGHGGSEATPGEYSLQQLAEDVLELRGKLGIRNMHLCGISLGGMVAAAVAARQPDSVDGLVLCSTPVTLPGPPDGWDGRAAAVRARGMAPLADGMVQRMFSPAHLATNDPAVATLRTVFLHTRPDGYAGSCAVLRDADLARVLPQVRSNTLVVLGAADPLMPPATGESLAALLTNCRQVALPCGHFPPIEAAQAFAGEVIRWCSAASTAPASRSPSAAK